MNDAFKIEGVNRLVGNSNMCQIVLLSIDCQNLFLLLPVC